MSASPAPLLPIKQRNVRNAILRALGRHGVSQQTAESIWIDLTTGNDPRPANLPESIWYRGIKVDWPLGRHARVLHAEEVGPLNAALKAAGVRKRDDLLTQEDTAEQARNAYKFLHGHMSGVPSAQYGAYNPEPVREAKMRKLVEEASTKREIENEPIFAPPTWDLNVPLLVGPGIDASGVVDTCTEVSPKGMHCTLNSTHDGQHVNGSTRWGKRNRKHEPVLSTLVDEPVDNEPEIVPVDESDVPMCGAPGPFASVTCERIAEHEDPDNHTGFGYSWLGACLPLDEVTDEMIAATDKAERKARKAAKKAKRAAAAIQPTVEIVTTPERVVSAQPVPPLSEIDTLLAQLSAISTRLEGGTR